MPLFIVIMNRDLSSNGLTSLPTGGLNLLTALSALYRYKYLGDDIELPTHLYLSYLQNNALTSLPAGVFDTLTSMKTLYDCKSFYLLRLVVLNENLLFQISFEKSVNRYSDWWL